MKLIHHLERKLSFRKKASGNTSDRCRKSKQNSTVKVNDTEFSRYIQFSNQLLNVTAPATFSYQVVNIRPRLNQPQRVSLASDDRSSSLECEARLDDHIYDNIEQCRVVPSSKLHNPPPLPPALERQRSSVGPTTVTSACRRNRIRTNPWFSSRWSNKDTFQQNVSRQSTHPKDSLGSSEKSTNNDYEYIDWEDIDENLDSRNTSFATSGGRMSTFSVMKPCKSAKTPRNYEVSPRLRWIGYGPSPMPTHADLYPQSVWIDNCDRIDLVSPAPSFEFVTQSQQICSEITNYFDSSPIDEQSILNKITSESMEKENDKTHIKGSFETIDLTLPDDSKMDTMSMWSVVDASEENKENCVQFSPRLTSTPLLSSASKQASMPCKANIINRSPVTSKANKRKRNDSAASLRLFRKLDRLKSELKEVVHAAILEAKKEQIIAG